MKIFLKAHTFVIILSAIIFSAVPYVTGNVALAKGGGHRIELITDIETDEALRRISAPLLGAAGISPEQVRFHIVKDPSLNAFVMGGMNIYVHTGLIHETDDLGELIGVLAHEIGHISGGHLLRGDYTADKISTNAIFASLLGIGAAVAAKSPEVGIASVLAAQSIAQRSMLSYTRSEESSADQAAMKFLTRAQYSGQGLESFMSKLADQELIPRDKQDVFMRTHPLSSVRVEALHEYNQNSPYAGRAFPEQDQKLFYTIKAKFLGYFHPNSALKKFENQRTNDEKYGYAYALMQKHRVKEAIEVMESLTHAQPNNPFYHEFKAQLHFELGQTQQAAQEYKKAVELLPSSDLMKLYYAQTLIEMNQQAQLPEARKMIDHTLAHQQDSIYAWHLLSICFGREEKKPEMHYAMAQKSFLADDREEARYHIELAKKTLSKSSPYYIKLEDLSLRLEQIKDEPRPNKKKRVSETISFDMDQDHDSETEPKSGYSPFITIEITPENRKPDPRDSFNPEENRRGYMERDYRDNTASRNRNASTHGW